MKIWANTSGKTYLASCGLIAIGALLSLATSRATEFTVFPNNFRSWAHVKSALITPAHPAGATDAGLHHIYANTKAMEGYRTGKFPEGSIIVYELLETREEGGLISERGRRRVDVMIKEPDGCNESGGWRFGSFPLGDPDKEVVGMAGQSRCFNCHNRAEATGFVFSRVR